MTEPETGAARERGAEPETGTGPDAAGLRQRIEELQTQVSDLEDRWRRALADLDNLRKRVIRDVERVRADEQARAAAEWLPVLDNLERALEHAETDPASIVEGLKAIRDQAQDVLSRLGFARRDDAGTMFDPARHEAVAVLTQEDAPEGTVLHVIRPAYGDGERQLRPAMVVVAKGE
ncbi:nucleotide exchange factor GrpE [Streptosporangium lutulentum]